MNDPAKHQHLIAVDEALKKATLDKQQGSIDVRWIWRVIWGHKFSIAGLTFLIMVISALFAFRQTPLYRAQATLQIEHNPTSYSPVNDQISMTPDYWRYYETQYGLIKRRAIGELVIKDLGYDQNLDKDLDKSPVDDGWSWKSLFPDEWFPKPKPPTVESRYNSLVNWIVSSITVTPHRNSQLVDIGFVSADPKQAALIANSVAKAFIADNLEGRLQMTRAAADYLDEQLVSLKQNLENSEQALQRYLDEKQLIDVKGVDSLINQELTLGTAKLAEARKLRSEAEVVRQQINNIRSQGEENLIDVAALIDHPQARSSYEAYMSSQRSVEELSNRYGPKHPRMLEAQSEQDAARSILQRQLVIAANAIEREYQAALQAERSAERELDLSKGRLRDVDRSEFEYQRLSREVETNQQLYDRFLTQIKESSVSDRDLRANARIINEAMIPTAPFKPNKRRAVMLAMFLGLMLSIGLAFLLDHLDNTFKNIEDVENKLGVPVLGVLQKIKSEEAADKHDPIRHFARNKKSVFSEVIRTIRTGVLLSSLDDDHKILLVTSSVPGEGKTTVSMNLANALSEMRTVLLIDADMRRPMVAKALQREGKIKGLSQFITGEANLSECIHKLDRESNLYVMPAGVIPPNPLEMLSSHRFEEGLEKLAEKFDHIVLDCAPVLAVSDALVLSRKASSVVFVIKSDSTPIQAVRNGLKQMNRIGAKVIGTVINQVQNKTRRYYGKYSNYGGDYYSSYEYYRRDEKS